MGTVKGEGGQFCGCLRFEELVQAMNMKPALGEKIVPGALIRGGFFGIYSIVYFLGFALPYHPSPLHLRSLLSLYNRLQLPRVANRILNHLSARH